MTTTGHSSPPERAVPNYPKGPNGVLFELTTDGPDFSTDEPVETMGERLALLFPWSLITIHLSPDSAFPAYCLLLTRASSLCVLASLREISFYPRRARLCVRFCLCHPFEGIGRSQWFLQRQAAIVAQTPQNRKRQTASENSPVRYHLSDSRRVYQAQRQYPNLPQWHGSKMEHPWRLAVSANR
jgi:hypothetical protein